MIRKAQYLRNLDYPKPQGLKLAVAASQTIVAGELMAIANGQISKATAAASAIVGLSSGSINTGVRATQTLTFSGVAVDNQTVTIGESTFELTVDGVITAGNIAVDMSSGVTADIAVVKIADTINNIKSFDFTAVGNTTADTVVITAKSSGTDYNGIATTETCTNAAWGAAATASGTTVADMKDSDELTIQPIMPGDVIRMAYTGGVPNVSCLFTTRYDMTSAQVVNLADTTGGFLIPVGFDLDNGTIDVVVDMSVLWNA